MPIEREVFRTVSELVVLYELEPKVRDVFVEGITDKTLLEQFFDRSGIKGVNVYEISSVSILYEEFVEKALPDNNRSRVMVLAERLFEECSQDLEQRVVCVADLDFDALYGRQVTQPLLLFTDFVAVELYAFSVSAVKKFCSIVLKKPSIDAAAILDALEAPLRSLFLIRAIACELNLNVQMLAIEKNCEVSKSKVCLDVASYVQKLLNKAARPSDHQKFADRISALVAQVPSDARLAIHGHDYVDLLRYYLVKVLRPARGYDEAMFGGALMSTLETEDLRSFRLFRELYTRLGSAVERHAA